MELSSPLGPCVVQQRIHAPSQAVPNGFPSHGTNGDLSATNHHGTFDDEIFPNNTTPAHDHDTTNMPPALVSDQATPLQASHVVQLSAIEHCMPRAYIRVCLAYRRPSDVPLPTIMARLNQYTRKLVDAKPYLAGYVVPAADSTRRVGLVEIRFTDEDFLHFPAVEVRHFTQTEVPYDYDQLDRMGLPPSIIRPELVSALPEGTDDEMAPAFRMQANIVDGGLVVSVYLHHCIADGTGLGFLLTGAVMNDEFAFNRHLDPDGYPMPSLNARLDTFANRKTIVRHQLSWSDHNQISDRSIRFRTRDGTGDKGLKTKPVGRGCIVALSRSKLDALKSVLHTHAPESYMSQTDALRK